MQEKGSDKRKRKMRSETYLTVVTLTSKLSGSWRRGPKRAKRFGRLFSKPSTMFSRTV